MSPNTSFLRIPTGLFLCLSLLPAAGIAQEPAPPVVAPPPVVTPQPPAAAAVTAEEVIERIRQSGITRQDARTRLTQAGYDPALADPYFDRLEGRTNQTL